MRACVRLQGSKVEVEVKRQGFWGAYEEFCFVLERTRLQRFSVCLCLCLFSVSLCGSVFVIEFMDLLNQVRALAVGGKAAKMSRGGDTEGTVLHRGMGTGISEASTRVPIFSFATQGGKQVSFYFRQRNWVQAREAQIRFPAGRLEFDSIE